MMLNSTGNIYRPKEAFMEIFICLPAPLPDQPSLPGELSGPRCSLSTAGLRRTLDSSICHPEFDCTQALVASSIRIDDRCADQSAQTDRKPASGRPLIAASFGGPPPDLPDSLIRNAQRCGHLPAGTAIDSVRWRRVRTVSRRSLPTSISASDSGLPASPDT